MKCPRTIGTQCVVVCKRTNNNCWIRRDGFSNWLFFFFIFASYLLQPHIGRSCGISERGLKETKYDFENTVKFFKYLWNFRSFKTPRFGCAHNLSISFLLKRVRWCGFHAASCLVGTLFVHAVRSQKNIPPAQTLRNSNSNVFKRRKELRKNTKNLEKPSGLVE